jgi:putative transposase
VVGFAIGKKHNSQLILSAINQALLRSKSTPEIFHSDQGTEFMAQCVTGFLTAQEIKISVSDTASPWQNGHQESFFGKLKFSLGDLNRFEDPAEMIIAIYQYIDYYNNRRIHRSLKMPPAVFARSV